MYYRINGVEINPELTFSSPGKIYINEGTFEGEKGITKFESTGIQYKCNDWVDNGYTRINVYYNPDINKLQLSPENIYTPNSSYGFHLGGITLRQTDNYGNCLDKILLPDNGEVEHNKYFNYEYDEAYLHLYHTERPENIFDEGFDEGFDQENNSIWDSLL
jgi:hypothetical protein